MGDYFKHLLNLEETIPMLRRLISFIYCTKMSITWGGAFFLLLILACFEIRDIAISYVFAATGGVVGIALSIFTIFSMTDDVKEVIRLRELYSKFITCLRDDPGHAWDPKTKSTFRNFHDLFKHVCPEVSRDALDLPDDVPPKTMKDAQRAVLEQRKIKP